MILRKGQHLFTRDGRRRGNAIVLEEIRVGVWLIESDFGHRYQLTTAEILGLFYLKDLNCRALVTDPDAWHHQRLTVQVENELPKPEQP